MHFEKKVEEDYLCQALDEEGCGSIRPENIPGALRILPTTTPPGSCPGSRPGSRSSSQKSSLVRSNSVDSLARCNLLSPITTPRSLQQSPAFVRKHENPPPMFKPPEPDVIMHSLGQLTLDTTHGSNGSISSGFRSVKLVLAEKEKYEKRLEKKDPTHP